MPRLTTAIAMSEPVSAESRPLVLLAEDNPVNQKVAAAMLAKIGYRCEVVSNGLEAVEAVGRVRYAAVLMDCQMPEMDGYVATAEIRVREHPDAYVPIIAMTAAAMQGDMERAMAAGMDDYLTKPVELSSLKEMLQRWTRISAAAQLPSRSEAPGGTPADTFDTQRVAQLRELTVAGQPDGFAVLAGWLVAEGKTLIGAVGDAVRRLDAAAAARHLHRLRGGAATIGAQRLARLCGDLEDSIESGTTLPHQDALALLKAELALVEASLPSSSSSSAAVAIDGVRSSPPG